MSTYVIHFTCAGKKNCFKTTGRQNFSKNVNKPPANKARTCIGTRPQANTSLISRPQNNS